MKKSILLLGTVLLMGSATISSSAEKPRLKLKAPRTVFMKPTGMDRYAPVEIQVRAELEGNVEDAEAYYCLAEEWEWGDETQSLHEPDCDPYKEGAELKRFYNASHSFRYPGNYTVYLRLQKGKKTVLAGSVTLRVRGS